MSCALERKQTSGSSICASEAIAADGMVLPPTLQLVVGGRNGIREEMLVAGTFGIHAAS